MKKKYSGVGLVLIITVLLTVHSNGGNAAYDGSGTAAVACQMQLLTSEQALGIINGELERLSLELPRIGSLLLSIRSSKIRADFLARCEGSGMRCNPDELLKVAQEIISQYTSFPLLRNMKYLLIGNAVLSAMTSSLLYMGPDSGILQMFLTQFVLQVGIMAAVGLSPLSETLSAAAKKFAYEKVQIAGDPTTKQYRLLHTAHDVMNQLLTSRYYEIDDILDRKLKEARAQFLNGKVEIAGRLIGEAAIINYQLFKEFELNAAPERATLDRRIFSTVQTSFSLHFPNDGELVRSLFPVVIAYIRLELGTNYDKPDAKGKTAGQYFEEKIRNWLTPENTNYR